jgi:hypothetical protein
MCAATERSSPQDPTNMQQKRSTEKKEGMRMRATKRRVGIGTIILMVAMLAVLLAPNVASAWTWTTCVEQPHWGSWFMSWKLYGPSWQKITGQTTPCLQVSTRMYYNSSVFGWTNTGDVIKTKYNVASGTKVSATAEASSMGQDIWEAYSYATFLVQWPDQTWSWNSYYGPHWVAG